MVTITVIEFTSNTYINSSLSFFVYITAIICPFFAAFSLMDR